MRRASVLLGAAVRLVLILVLVAVVVALPLLFVHRARCEGESRYRVAPPGDEAPSGCARDQTGLEVLRDELGLD